ncbi:hypothetical protein OXX80_001139 [Metschnikowia pulcherrima]
MESIFSSDQILLHTPKIYTDSPRIRMSYLYVWHSVPVNKSKRPFLTDAEHHVFVKDGVGIYQGKSKIKHYQNGRVYLTNKRIIYLDSANPPCAVAVNLSDIIDAEYVERFLRSSPKVKVYLKVEATSSVKESLPHSVSEPNVVLAQPEVVDWVCGICSFNNHMSTQINLATQLPKCVSCGIPPSREQLQDVLDTVSRSGKDSGSSKSSDTDPDQCPKCTFINHPSMRFCEVCGAPLKQASKSLLKKIKESERNVRTSNPLGLVLEDSEIYTNNSPYVKISFRKGGDADFYKHLREIIDKNKWEALEAKGGVSGDATRVVPTRETTPKVQSRGIQGLVKIGELQRKQNELVLSSSLEDLEQLMDKAKEILELTSSFGSLIKKAPVPIISMPPLTVSPTSSIYHQELAQHMCEYLLTYVLTKPSSMITTQDLFASYNRFSVMSQGFGGDLVTTQNFQKCLSYFDTLQLPVKLKTFQSGLVVITQRLHDSQDLHQVISDYLAAEENRFMYEKYTSEYLADSDGYMKDVYKFFHGKTVAEIADHFGWSSTICVEELARCMDDGLVVLDKHISGTFYFLNRFDPILAEKIDNETAVKLKAQKDVLSQQKTISSELKSQQESNQQLLAFDNFDFGTQEGSHTSSEDIQSSNSAGRDEPVSATLSLLDGLKF